MSKNIYKCSFDLTTLNGENGFSISSPYPGSWLGYSINFIKDINGDHIDDIVIGAPNASPTNFQAGQSYIIFGSNQSFSADLNVANLDGTNGFAISGISADDNSGFSVSSAGDINNDGINDILVGAPNAIFGFGPGEVYVIFGHAGSFSAIFNLSSINGTNGFIISGVQESDNVGFSVSAAGDVNNDGIDDILIGNPLNRNEYRDVLGQAYTIFGSASGFSSIFYVTDLNGANGFILNGDISIDNSISPVGFAVAGLGDVNGDKIADIVVGAPDGGALILFGNAGGFPAVITLNTLNGNNGFAFQNDLINEIGISVSRAGDINGDGINDILVGTNSSDSYVIFGSTESFPATLSPDSLNGNNGFIIQSLAEMTLPWSVSGMGDVNADGYNDIMIANPSLNNQAGISYVIYGKAKFNGTVTLENLDNTTGYQIDGTNPGDGAGVSVGGWGDINADGINDMLIGASEANTGYVVFGSKDSSNIPCHLVHVPTTPTITHTLVLPTEVDSGDKFSVGEIAGIAAGVAGGALLGALAYYGKTHGWCSHTDDASYAQV